MPGCVWPRNPSWPKCAQGSAQPPQERGSLLAQVVLSVPSSATRTVPCRELAQLPAPSPPLLTTKSSPCTQSLGLSEVTHSGQAQPAWPAPHSCLGKFGVQGAGQGLVPCPCQPQAEAQNSPEGSRSSAAQKTQRQGRCRSGRSCSRCRVCLSSQGPEREADEESEAGFTLISLTQAGSALPQQ